MWYAFSFPSVLRSLRTADRLGVLLGSLVSDTQKQVNKALLLVLASLCTAASGQEELITPEDSLLSEGVPTIPASLVQEAQRYTEVRSASFADWHPLKRAILIRTRFADTTQVHRVAMPGGARYQLTYFKEPVKDATYEPRQGRYFVFTKDRGGDEFYQIYRFDLGTGRETLLTDGEGQHALGPWSNDGEWLSFWKLDEAQEGAFTELYLIDPARPETKHRLARFPGGGWSIADWSQEDVQLLAQELISVNESHLWMVDVRTEKKTRIGKSSSKVAYLSPRFSKKRPAVYVASDEGSEFLQLTKIDLADHSSRILSKHIPWDVIWLDVSHDGSRVAFVTNEDSISRLRLMATSDEREIQAPRLPQGVFNKVRWHKDRPELAFALSSAHMASDVYSVDVNSGKLTRWTFSETGGLDPSIFAAPRSIRWRSFDGRELRGLLYRPPKKFVGKRPVMIYFHGGPESQARADFKAEINYYLNGLGIAVIYPNVRGSSGYGKTFLKLDDEYKRVDAYKDAGALLDWIAENPALDAQRVLATGFSYGGHMALALATHYPDRIRCAVDAVGIANLRTFLENTKGYRRDLRRAEYGDERDPKMRAFLEEIAPLNQAHRISKPLLVIQGANDPRVPASESQQIVSAARKNGAPVWYLLAQDEGHGFRKKKNADFSFYTTIRFLQEYLLK